MAAHVKNAAAAPARIQSSRLRPDDLLARFEEVRRAEQLDKSAAEMLRRYRFPVPWVTLSSFSGAIIAADLMAVTAGTRLGPHEILAPLGVGGMGEGYRARDTRLDRTVAIKSLPATFAGDADRLDRFEHEARLLSTVNHPNLLAIHDVGAQDGVHYLASEFLEGQTLREKMNTSPLSQRRVLNSERHGFLKLRFRPLPDACRRRACFPS